MREEVVWDLALGKVVEDFVFSHTNAQVVVCFDDDTFTTFSAMRDYGDDIVVRPCELGLFEFGDEQLLEAGVIGEEELELRRTERDADYLKAHEDAQRRAYERLKKKFEVDG